MNSGGIEGLEGGPADVIRHRLDCASWGLASQICFIAELKLVPNDIDDCRYRRLFSARKSEQE